MAKPKDGAIDLVSIPSLLRRNAAAFGLRAAYREKEFGIWQTWSWSDALSESENMALGLIELGVSAGDFVAIIGRNRPQLYLSMVAVQMVGATPVPLYQDAVAEEMAYVLGHCGAKYVIAGDQEQVDKVLEIRPELPNFEQMLYLDGRGLRKYDHSNLNSLASIIDKGKSSSDKVKKELAKREKSLTS
ncbi:MAG: long-chain fatty acid--CoA ligase, partial [Rhodobacteraceae bacterium]|nr:long-chain fatty acid--CoA ligase [Paracoccaceae bacterium]